MKQKRIYAVFSRERILRSAEDPWELIRYMRSLPRHIQDSLVLCRKEESFWVYVPVSIYGVPMEVQT